MLNTISTMKSLNRKEAKFLDDFTPGDIVLIHNPEVGLFTQDRISTIGTHISFFSVRSHVAMIHPVHHIRAVESFSTRQLIDGLNKKGFAVVRENKMFLSEAGERIVFRGLTAREYIANFLQSAFDWHMNQLRQNVNEFIEWKNQGISEFKLRDYWKWAADTARHDPAMAERIGAYWTSETQQRRWAERELFNLKQHHIEHAELRARLHAEALERVLFNPTRYIWYN